MTENKYQSNLKRLFEVEQEANKIILRAQEKYDEFMEEAVKKADAEISILKNKMEIEFQKNNVDFTEEDKRLEETVESEKKLNVNEFNKNKGKAISMLIDRCFSVNIDLQRNLLHKEN